MKKLLIVLLTASGIAQSHSQTWKTDIDSALKEAVKTNKKVLLFFTVPEQCDNCHLLEDNILKSDEFLSFAEKAYILVRVDFAVKGEDLTEKMAERNLLIVEKYNKDGFFPLVVILDKTSKVLGKSGVYKDEAPSQFISLLRSFERS